MHVLTVTAKGRVTLPKEVLQHLGVAAGGTIEIDLSSGATATLRATGRKRGIEAFFGSLHDPNGPSLTLEEIDEAIKDAWAGIPPRER